MKSKFVAEQFDFPFMGCVTVERSSTAAERFGQYARGELSESGISRHVSSWNPPLRSRLTKPKDWVRLAGLALLWKRTPRGTPQKLRLVSVRIGKAVLRDS
ncbi:MAG: hypothetical protein FD161_1733 [Limisphaerales bacterium]|nr:MAG: hypothetical protein FD161_1733 [Limisphaerales bacterium]KAG0509169.1 MAG: hypothetical protein E1N63_1652 [Limisphaerales bacterium]TXT52491.1 MAG: hypothetical protein FD140_715 [Limisphaerales bacterium]